MIFALFAGLTMKGKWLEFAAYLNRTPTSLSDPIFQKPLEFYLFSLPVLDAMSSWLMTLTFVIVLRGADLLTAIAAADDAKERALAFVRNKLRSNLRRTGSVSARICLAGLSLAFSLLCGAIIRHLLALLIPKPTTCFRH